MELDPVARDIVLRSIKQAIPSEWRAKCDELRSLGDVTLATYLEETGLELEDVYANNRSWSALRRAVGLRTDDAGPDEDALLRAVGRLLHVDDRERLDAYRSLVEPSAPPDPNSFSDRERRHARMLIGSLTTLKTSAPLAEGLAELWEHPQVRRELVELLDLLPERVDHLHAPLDIANVPLAVHAALHAGRDPRGVRHRERRQAAHLAVGRLVGREQPDRPVRVHARQVGRLVLADDSIPRLRDQPGADPLGESVRDVARQRHGPSVHQPGRERNERGAVRSAQHRRPSLLVPRPGDLRLAPRRTTDRDHLAAPPPPVRRPLRRVRRRCRLNRVTVIVSR